MTRSAYVVILTLFIGVGFSIFFFWFGMPWYLALGLPMLIVIAALIKRYGGVRGNGQE